MSSYPLRQEYLVCYDVQDNRLRTRVFKELQATGLKAVQRSVFWGYLTRAELNGIRRFLRNQLKSDDRAFITHSNFNGRGQSFLVGHPMSDFTDWDETDVI